jgi:hypothetical protein
MTGIQAINNWSFHTAAVQNGTHWWNDSSTRIPEAQIARSRTGGAMNDTAIAGNDDAWTDDDSLDVNSSDNFSVQQDGLAEFSAAGEIGDYAMDDDFKTALGTNMLNNPHKSFAAITPANRQDIVSLLSNH